MTQNISALFLLSAITINSAWAQKSDSDLVYHYSVMDAMRNAVYQGNLTLRRLGEKGNFGLGTYNQLDGEMIAVDGVYYRVATDGAVTQAEPERMSPFASVTFFKSDIAFELAGEYTTESLRQAIEAKLPSRNIPYAIRVDCMFDEITLGGAYKVPEDEKNGLAELMKTRPLYKKQKVTGTIVGFYNPHYASAIDLSPFHFHFISKDRKIGGHLVSGAISTPAKVFADQKTGYELALPSDVKQFNKTWEQGAAAKSVY